MCLDNFLIETCLSTDLCLYSFSGGILEPFSLLQDQVPPFPSETAVSIIEEELGASVNKIFDRFDFEPIAAASLGNKLT